MVVVSAVWWWTCQPAWCGVPACVVSAVWYGLVVDMPACVVWCASLCGVCSAVQCGVVVDMPVCVGLEISTIVYHHRGDNNPLINSMWKSVNIKLQTIGRHPVGKEEQERFARLPIRRLQPSRGSSCSWSKRVGQVQEGPNKIWKRDISAHICTLFIGIGKEYQHQWVVKKALLLLIKKPQVLKDIFQ